MTLAEQLVDAQNKYHLLVTGGAVAVFVDQNGERVQYSAASKAGLYSYIQQLMSQISNGGLAVGPTPLTFWF